MSIKLGVFAFTLSGAFLFVGIYMAFGGDLDWALYLSVLAGLLVLWAMYLDQE